MLDEQLQLMLFLAAKLGRGMPVADLTVAQRREAMDLEAGIFAPISAPLAKVETLRTDGGLEVRAYRPRGVPSPAPALVYFHGGGFVVGSLDSHDSVCRALAAEAGCVVLSVAYRLAPEHPFPAAPDDCTAAFRWAAREAATLGIDPRRIAVGGDSAGGNLAAVTALDTREDALRPCFQALIYPCADMTLSFPSIDKLASGFLLERATMVWFRERYCPDPKSWTNPRVAPWFADSVAGVAPALVQTAGFDPLRDEGEAYATRLRAAGVAVEAKRYPSMIHGYLNMGGSVTAARAPLDDLTAALRKAFG